MAARILRAIVMPLILCVAACTAGPSAARSEKAGADAFMRAYVDTWNRHDAASIARDFYALGPSMSEQEKRLEAQFRELREQGYSRSVLHELKTCPSGPARAWAAMKFTRLKSNGEPLGPHIRASDYDLVYDEARGWRISALRSRAAEAPLTCPSRN